MLKVLDVEGAVTRKGTQLAARARQRLALRRRPLRPRHRAAPARAGGDGGLRRRRPLPDARAARGARRPRPAGLRRSARSAPRRASTARSTRRSSARPRCTCARARCVLDVKKMAPDAEGKMNKLGDDVRAEEGRALARLGDGGWDPLVQAGRRAGRFDDELVEAAAEAVRTLARRRSRWVTAVPSTRSGDAGAGLRAAAGRRAGPAVPPGARARRRQPAAARDGQLRPAGGERARRVRGHRTARRRRACLLVDDIRFSGWTLAMVAGQLRRQGAGAGLPARAVHRVLSGVELQCRASDPPVLRLRTSFTHALLAGDA